jgi:hypothetical protein
MGNGVAVYSGADMHGKIYYYLLPKATSSLIAITGVLFNQQSLQKACPNLQPINYYRLLDPRTRQPRKPKETK